MTLTALTFTTKRQEGKAERPRRGKEEKSSRGIFFLAHKFHSYKIANILDILHPRKIKDGARWILMEIKLAWEDFVLLYFPSFFSFQYVAYIIVTVALIASHQGKKGIKIFFPFHCLSFSLSNKGKLSTHFSRKCVLSKGFHFLANSHSLTWTMASYFRKKVIGKEYFLTVTKLTRGLFSAILWPPYPWPPQHLLGA